MRCALAVGAASYSLYLIHFPLFRIAGVAWIGYWGMKPTSFLTVLAASAVVIPIVILMHRYVELPWNRFARSVAARS